LAHHYHIYFTKSGFKTLDLGWAQGVGQKKIAQPASGG